VQSHVDGELEMSKEGQDLTWSVVAFEDSSTLCVAHAADHRVAVLHVKRSPLHRNEHHFRIESIDQEVS
jgi:hypothetical protein